MPFAIYYLNPFVTEDPSCKACAICRLRYCLNDCLLVLPFLLKVQNWCNNVWMWDSCNLNDWCLYRMLEACKNATRGLSVSLLKFPNMLMVIAPVTISSCILCSFFGVLNWLLLGLIKYQILISLEIISSLLCFERITLVEVVRDAFLRNRERLQVLGLSSCDWEICESSSWLNRGAL